MLGVDALNDKAALTLLLPGTVIEPRYECPGPRLAGVAGGRCELPPKFPSLVPGRLPFPVADAGRAGGAIETSAVKKLDFRLPIPPGEEGICARLSTVLSDNEGRDFLGFGKAYFPFSSVY